MLARQKKWWVGSRSTHGTVVDCFRIFFSLLAPPLFSDLREEALYGRRLDKFENKPAK